MASELEQLTDFKTLWVERRGGVMFPIINVVNGANEVTTFSRGPNNFWKEGESHFHGVLAQFPETAEAVNGPSAAARLYKFAGFLGLLDSTGENDTVGLVPWMSAEDWYDTIDDIPDAHFPMANGLLNMLTGDRVECTPEM